MSTSVLLERSEYLLEKIYQATDDPSPSLLFDATELAECREQSPVWLDCARNPRVLEFMRQEPEQWPGLILESSVPTDTLLEHLRQILLVRFGEQRKGVLCYCNPTTASYFFAADAAQSLALWLGPVSRLSWYGGTWADQAEDKERWLSVDNPQAAQWRAMPGAAPARLSRQQEQALQRQRKEQFLYQWWKRQRGLPFTQASEYLEQGMDLGFVQAEELQRFLDLRLRYAQHGLPRLPAHTSNEDRLELLRRHWQDKESLT